MRANSWLSIVLEVLSSLYENFYSVSRLSGLALWTFVLMAGSSECAFDSPVMMLLNLSKALSHNCFS